MYLYAQVVYFGDSMKSDVYPPKHFASWDTVAVLEELEAEEVHFHKNNEMVTGDILENKGSVRWGSKGHYAEGVKMYSAE